MAKPVLKMYDNEKTYQELFEDYIASIKIQGMAEETIRTYYYHHKYFMKFIGYDIKCNDIDISLLNNYKMMLLDRNLSKVTIIFVKTSIEGVKIALFTFGADRVYCHQLHKTLISTEKYDNINYTEIRTNLTC